MSERSRSANDELSELIRDEHAFKVSAVLGCLSDNERDLIILAFYSEHTHRQIATELGIPIGTVKSRIRSALSKLRLVLCDLCDAAPSPTRTPARIELELVLPKTSSTTSKRATDSEVA